MDYRFVGNPTRIARRVLAWSRGSQQIHRPRQIMSFLVSPRIVGQPTNTGSQHVRTRYSSTDGTATAAGTPNAERPPISAASTAPTPPGVGAAEASVPPIIVTTVTVTNVVPPPKA